MQQNSFDLVEANCGTDRQRYVTDKLIYVLGSDYAINDKDDARSFINRLRQKFINWNYSEFMSDDFKRIEAEIDEMYQQNGGILNQEAELLLKGGE